MRCASSEPAHIPNCLGNKAPRCAQDSGVVMRCWQAAGFVLRQGGRNAGIACVALELDETVAAGDFLLHQPVGVGDKARHAPGRGSSIDGMGSTRRQLGCGRGSAGRAASQPWIRLAARRARASRLVVSALDRSSRSWAMASKRVTNCCLKFRTGAASCPRAVRASALGTAQETAGSGGRNGAWLIRACRRADKSGKASAAV